MSKSASVPSGPRDAPETAARWTRRKDARPGEILDAALELFVARGFAATKVEDIARAAGVTAGTIYRYYANKEDMLKAVIQESYERTYLEGDQLFAQFRGTGPELLAEVIRAWWRLVGSTRLSGLPKLMIAEAANFPELAQFHREAVIERGEGYIARAIEYGIARGEFRPLPVDIAVKVVCAPVVMAMIWRHAPLPCNAGDLDIERYLDEVIHTLIQGLAVRPAGSNPER
ncbi:TetR/AcrR family transcriptional regulator [Chitinimonas koreensis]|uniref:TetR/AcrR family transcriptional regulator n=1 Tax=Chitinimonas koreensis TaxID=356302 RepID=UPI0003FD29C9|nr:TetR/AcrR family transcriptional regulator [Chitinimonas koreensis]